MRVSSAPYPAAAPRRIEDPVRQVAGHHIPTARRAEKRGWPGHDLAVVLVRRLFRGIQMDE
jgi:hypothetical protein